MKTTYMNVDQIRKDLAEESRRLEEAYVAQLKRETQDEKDWAAYCENLLKDLNSEYDY